MSTNGGAASLAENSQAETTSGTSLLVEPTVINAEVDEKEGESPLEPKLKEEVDTDGTEKGSKQSAGPLLDMNGSVGRRWRRLGSSSEYRDGDVTGDGDSLQPARSWGPRQVPGGRRKWPTGGNLEPRTRTNVDRGTGGWIIDTWRANKELGEGVVLDSQKNVNRSREQEPYGQRPRQSGYGSRSKVSDMPRGQQLVKEVVIALLANGNVPAGEVLRPFVTVLSHDMETWNEVMKDLEKRGTRKRALLVFEFMVELAKSQEIRIQQNNFNTIILILGREGKMRVAHQIFDSMQELQMHPGVVSYCSLMTGYAKHRLVKEAFEVFEAMLSEGIKPTLVAYNILIHACAKSGLRINRAVQLYAQMKENEVEPDGITFNSMINACVRGGLLEEALLVFQEMKDSDCSPNVVTYSILIDALGKNGRLEDAAKVFQEMKEYGHDPNAWTYNALIRAYGKAGKLRVAVGVYKDMETAGLEPDLFTYNTVLNLYGQEGYMEEAEGLLDQMQRKGCTPDRVTYNILLDSYSKGGHLSKAMRVLETMRGVGCSPDLYTYTILLDACSKSGSVEEAQRMFQDLKAAGHTPNLVAFSAMINAYGRKGKWREAEQMWTEMRASGCRPNAITYCGLINAYAQQGDYISARSVFNEMVRVGVQPDVKSYTALMEAYARVGEYKKAEKIIQEMQQQGFVPDVVMYAVLVRAFARARKFESALDYFEYVVVEGDPLSDICRQVIQNYGEMYIAFTGKVPEGVDMKHWTALVEAGKADRKLGKSEDSESWLQEVKTVTTDSDVEEQWTGVREPWEET